jgi:hypothetical protein
MTAWEQTVCLGGNKEMSGTASLDSIMFRYTSLSVPPPQDVCLSVCVIFFPPHTLNIGATMWAEKMA